MERRPIVILMRYSVLKGPTAPKTGWQLVKKNEYADYRAVLLAPERLRERLQAFKTIVLPSLLAQTRPLDASQHCLVMLTSTELPAPELAALREAIAPYPWILLQPLVPQDAIPFGDSAKAALMRMEFSEGTFATVRLDDDDGLARTYFQQLERLIVEDNVGKVVTFPSGYFGKFDHRRGDFTEFYRSHQTFNAQGLAGIHRFADGEIEPADRPTVYQFGRHSDIGTNGLPYIEDASFPAYLRSIYPTQDSAFRAKDLEPSNRVGRDEVELSVGLAKRAESGLGALVRWLGLNRT